eukprot:TRINITY_DN114219_c0_g1_i1.p1 TRINITY_DN114219_c0_g1~~TRINITY_DN114219_c0_g1_i1.p1  ORF type:complete len:310 (-),score=43.68 TRINITY_DN114219_c0_g1_i1:20-949(-)
MSWFSCCCPSSSLARGLEGPIFAISAHTLRDDTSSIEDSETGDGGGMFPLLQSFGKLVLGTSAENANQSSTGGLCTQAFLAALDSLSQGRQDGWKASSFYELISSMEDVFRSLGHASVVLTVRSSIPLRSQTNSLGMAFGVEGHCAWAAGGVKRALLVGLCYPSSQDLKLKGSWNDVKDMHEWLSSSPLAKNGEIRMLIDRSDFEPHQQPTRDNVLKNLEWLLVGSAGRPAMDNGGALFLHFSGHGDGGTLLLSNREGTSSFTEAELAHMVKRLLPSDCSLTCLFDCCDSSCLLRELPYELTPDGVDNS